jgi:hypothetical protein
MIFTGGLSMLFLEVGENLKESVPTQVHKNTKILTETVEYVLTNTTANLVTAVY